MVAGTPAATRSAAPLTRQATRRTLREEGEGTDVPEDVVSAAAALACSPHRMRRPRCALKSTGAPRRGRVTLARARRPAVHPHTEREDDRGEDVDDHVELRRRRRRRCAARSDADPGSARLRGAHEAHGHRRSAPTRRSRGATARRAGPSRPTPAPSTTTHAPQRATAGPASLEAEAQAAAPKARRPRLGRRRPPPVLRPRTTRSGSVCRSRRRRRSRTTQAASAGAPRRGRDPARPPPARAVSSVGLSVRRLARGMMAVRLLCAVAAPRRRRLPPEPPPRPRPTDRRLQRRRLRRLVQVQRHGDVVAYDPAGVTSATGVRRATVSEDTGRRDLHLHRQLRRAVLRQQRHRPEGLEPAGGHRLARRTRTGTAGTRSPSPSPSAATAARPGSRPAPPAPTAGRTGGSVSISGSCTDGAGNAALGSLTIKYDATPPEVTAAAERTRRRRVVQPPGQGHVHGQGRGSGIAQCTDPSRTAGPTRTPRRSSASAATTPATSARRRRSSSGTTAPSRHRRT